MGREQSAWGPWLDVPLCPFCKEEVSDSPTMDFDCNGYTIVACGHCGEMVKVEGVTHVEFRVRKDDSGDVI